MLVMMNMNTACSKGIKAFKELDHADMYFTHGIRMPWVILQYTTLLIASLTKYMIDVQQQV